MIMVHFNYQEREKKKTIKEMPRKKIKWEIKNETIITIHKVNISWFTVILFISF
jgi:hypothetical protein